MANEKTPTGAETEFEFDRMTVERFRKTFPKARWDDVRRSWWVPGKTAERCIARWRALEQTRADIYADDKGRDAFEWDPIESPYLEPGGGVGCSDALFSNRCGGTSAGPLCTLG